MIKKSSVLYSSSSILILLCPDIYTISEYRTNLKKKSFLNYSFCLSNYNYCLFTKL